MSKKQIEKNPIFSTQCSLLKLLETIFKIDVLDNANNRLRNINNLNWKAHGAITKYYLGL